MIHNFFKKSFLASLSTMSVAAGLNAEEITLNKQAYNDLGEQINIPNENNLSLIQKYPKLSTIIAAIIGTTGGVVLKDPAKDLYKGLTYPAKKRKQWDQYRKALQKLDFYKFETVKLIKEQKGPNWCWLACFEGLLSSLGINKTQEELYSMTHFSSPKQTSADPTKLVTMLPKKPAFFEGNRDNDKIGDSDALVPGLFNGDAINYLAKRIDQNLYGCKFTISADYLKYVKPEGMEFIIRHVSEMIGGGWFAVGDPHLLMGHLLICKLQGDTMHFEDPIGPLAYSLDIKTWCKIASRAQELTVTEREAKMAPGIGIDIYAFTKKPISSRILYNFDNNGNLTYNCL